MNGTPDKISELYKLLPTGSFSNEEELRGYVTDHSKLKEVFGFMPQGAFTDESEYLSYFGDAIKKKNLLQNIWRLWRVVQKKIRLLLPRH